MVRNKTLIFILIALFLISSPLLGCGSDSGDENGNGEPDASTDSSTEDTGTGNTGNTDSSSVTDPEDVLNKSFFLTMEKSDWVRPQGVGSEMGDYVPGFAIQIISEDGGDPTVRWGIVDGSAQDTCLKTVDTTATLDEEAKLSVDAVDYETIVTGEEKSAVATIYDLSLSATFINNGTDIKSARLEATMDFRQIYELFHVLEDPTADKICDQAPTFGFECDACPGDGQNYCVTVVASSFDAAPAADLTLEEVTEFGEACLP